MLHCPGAKRLSRGRATLGLALVKAPCADLSIVGAFSQNSEGLFVCPCHEGSDVTIAQETQQGLTPFCIQMVERLIEQYERCPASFPCRQGSVVENDMHQHGLLLTAARQRRLATRQGILQQQIGAMGSERSIAFPGVLASRVLQRRAQRVLDGERRPLCQILFNAADKTQPGDRKRRVISYWNTVHGVDQRHPGSRQGNGMASDTVFEPIEPRRLVGSGGKQPVALRQGALVSGALTRMVRVERKHKPVEKPAPSRGRIAKQAIHLRRQPDGREMRGNLPLITYNLAIKTKDASCRIRRIGPCSKFERGIAIASQARHNAPGAALMALDLCIRRVAQTATGSKERKRFEQVGLARTILTGKNHEATARLPRQTLVITKIGENEPVYTQVRPANSRNQTRIGIST